MRIVNARLGFANNSSSSHSMIVLSRERAAEVVHDFDGDQYGWENFTLATPESKLDYLATAVWQQLSSLGDDTSAVVVARELMGLPDWTPLGTIDHQSGFELPGSEDGAPIDTGFARAFASWIQSAGVVVLGGNDNDKGHPRASGDALPFPREGPNPFVAKYDEQSDSWTLFNRFTGAKLRMKFEPGEAWELRAVEPRGARARAASAPSVEVANGEPSKLGSPELVDVKITDYCDIGCAYCYQGSTPSGAHAKLNDVRELARRLFKAGVLEVALGGGEPTRHPDFPEILEAFAAHGIVANFTTRDLSFLADEELSRRVLAASRSMAVSVNSVAQIQAALLSWRTSPGGSPRGSGPLAFQYVMGTSSDAELSRMIAECVRANLNLTLLGYKDSGRGLSWREGEGRSFALREAKVQNQTGSWMKMAREVLGAQGSYARLCIDTALARACERQLGAEGIPREFWHKSEGLVSMYVDAVSMSMGKSSYDAAMEPFDAGWLARFASWTPSTGETGAGRDARGSLNAAL